MTNTQLYLVIGIPSLLSLVGILLNTALYVNFSTTMNARMTSFETSMNARMAALETSMNARMASLETRMSNLENTFTTRFDLLMGRLTDIERGR
jgi:hypothetical protein